MSSDFSLSDFFEEHYELFALLGVFGAISIYLLQFPFASIMIQLGQMSSFIIFLLIAWSIRNSLNTQLDSDIFDYIIKPRRENFLVLIFIVSFYSLISSVIILAIQFQTAGILIAQFVLFFVGFSFVLWNVTELSAHFGYDENLGTIGRDTQVASFGWRLLVLSIVGIALSIVGLIHLQNRYEYGIESLQNVQPLGFVPFIVAFVIGILSGSLLYFAIAVMVLLIHWMIKKIDQSERRDEFIQAYKTLFGQEVNEETQSSLSDFED